MKDDEQKERWNKKQFQNFTKHKNQKERKLINNQSIYITISYCYFSIYIYFYYNNDDLFLSIIFIIFIIISSSMRWYKYYYFLMMIFSFFFLMMIDDCFERKVVDEICSHEMVHLPCVIRDGKMKEREIKINLNLLSHDQ